MNVKDFVKSLSIYGILPVFTKFAGFLLVPIYVRVLSQYDYGIVELIISTISFGTYLINLELYAAVGRFYFDREGTKQKQKLVSTGLLLTLSSAVVVLIGFILFQKSIHRALFPVGNFFIELRLGLLWALISAVSTYLSILPRYEKKAKRFVLFNIITVLVKLSSTIIFVVVLRYGIKGVLFGHIAGACSSTLLYSISAFRYLRLSFSKSDAKQILHFSLPLVPGVFLLGMYQPLMRTLITRVYDVNTLALFSFAYKITTIMAIVETGIRLAWRPMLYENIKKKAFGYEYEKISSFSAAVVLLMGICVISMSNEIISVIGTSQYLNSYKILGFLVMGNIFWTLDSLRGFGFEVAKRTYCIPMVSMFSRLIGVIFMLVISKRLGLIGIGIAMLVPHMIDFCIKAWYTKKLLKLGSVKNSELLLWVMLITSNALSTINVHIVFRFVPVLVSLYVFGQLYLERGKRMMNSYLKNSSI
jgi:O-antigen/teichoic acid export membrane protein